MHPCIRSWQFQWTGENSKIGSNLHHRATFLMVTNSCMHKASFYVHPDRFLAISFPLKRQLQITKKKAQIVILILWIWAATLALPWLLFFDLSHADEVRPSLIFCVESWPDGTDGNAYFVLANLLLFYLLPRGIISLCYFFIWLRVWRRPLPDDSAVSRVELIHQRAKVSVLKMLIFVVALFTISWLPLHAIFLRLKFGPHVIEGSVEESVLDLALPVAQWLS